MDYKEAWERMKNFVDGEVERWNQIVKYSVSQELKDIAVWRCEALIGVQCVMMALNSMVEEVKEDGQE